MIEASRILEAIVKLFNPSGSKESNNDSFPEVRLTQREIVKLRRIMNLIRSGGRFLGNIWTNRHGTSYYRIRVRYRGRIRTFRSAHPYSASPATNLHRDDPAEK